MTSFFLCEECQYLDPGVLVDNDVPIWARHPQASFLWWLDGRNVVRPYFVWLRRPPGGVILVRVLLFCLADGTLFVRYHFANVNVPSQAQIHCPCRFFVGMSKELMSIVDAH